MFYYESFVVEILVFGFLFLCINVYFWRSSIVCLVLFTLHSFNPVPQPSDFFTYWSILMFLIILFTTKDGIIIVLSFIFGYTVGNGSFKDWLKRRKLYADVGQMYITYQIFNNNEKSN